jgi:hypothetical protein
MLRDNSTKQLPLQGCLAQTERESGTALLGRCVRLQLVLPPLRDPVRPFELALARPHLIEIVGSLRPLFMPHGDAGASALLP